MADSKKVEAAKKATSNSGNVTEVTVHLDRDPNDPRNVKPADKLPSLND